MLLRVIIGVVLGMGVASARADDALSGGFRPDETLLFAGFDLWQHGYGGYAGAEWAPQPAQSQGPLLRLFTSSSIDRFGSRGVFDRTQTVRASFTPGWRMQTGSFIVKVFGGLDAEARVPLTSAEPRRHFLGGRVAAEAWWEPNAITMVSAAISATTIEQGYSARLATGWRVWDSDGAWIGPEAIVNSDIYSTQVRLGAHVTSIRFADLEWSGAAGYVHDSYGRNGIYGRVGVALKR